MNSLSQNIKKIYNDANKKIHNLENEAFKRLKEMEYELDGKHEFEAKGDAVLGAIETGAKGIVIGICEGINSFTESDKGFTERLKNGMQTLTRTIQDSMKEAKKQFGNEFNNFNEKTILQKLGNIIKQFFKVLGKELNKSCEKLLESSHLLEQPKSKSNSQQHNAHPKDHTKPTSTPNSNPASKSRGNTKH